MGLGKITRPNAGGEAVGAVVAAIDDFLDVVEGIGHHDGAKDFLAHNAHIIAGVSNNSGRHKIPLFTAACASSDAVGTSLLPGIHETCHAGELLFGNKRAHLGIVSETGAKLDCSGGIGNAFHHVIKNIFLNIKPRAGTATLAVIEKDRAGGTGDGRFKVSGIFENNVGRFAAQLEGDFFKISRGGVDNHFADLGGTGEGDLVHLIMRGQRGTGGFAHAGNNVHHAIGHARFL